MTVAGYISFSALLLLELALHVSTPPYLHLMGCSLWSALLWLFHWLQHPDGKIFLLSFVSAGTLHHQCSTLLWPWSSVSSHTLNAGCLAPIGGYRLLFACFACLGLSACLVLVFVWCWSLSSEAPFISICVIFASVDCKNCDTARYLLWITLLSPLWLKPYW